MMDRIRSRIRLTALALPLAVAAAPALAEKPQIGEPEDRDRYDMQERHDSNIDAVQDTDRNRNGVNDEFDRAMQPEKGKDVGAGTDRTGKNPGAMGNDGDAMRDDSAAR